MQKLSLGLIFLIIFADFSFANGGCQQTMNGYIVNLSMAPLVPRTGQETQMVLSFAADSKLIEEKIGVKVEIGSEVGNKVYERSFSIEQGAFDLSHRFAEAGRYHLKVEFLHNGKNVKVEFPIEAVKAEGKPPENAFVATFLAALIGVALGYFLKSWRK